MVLSVGPAFALCACLFVYGPVVSNDLSDPIVLNMSYADGRSDTLTLQPGVGFAQGGEGVVVTRIEATSEEDGPFVLEETEIRSGEGLFSADEIVAWRVTDHGIFPRSLDELAEVTP